ncbi:MAG: potassium transporter TrkG [Deltaproteobacteria bacterium]|nr:MAG: potassium transporter TrkG [Deltaproteobacteria bacterium]
MNLRNLAKALGLVLTGFGLIALTPVVVAILDKEYSGILPYVVASSVGVGLGILLRWRGGWAYDFDRISRTEGLCIVALSWVAVSAIGAIPYLFYGLSFVDACFESVSGITTTGATILVDFSLYPRDFFFWRSLSQWLGGMGIIVLFVAVFPQFAVAGRQIFFAEAPGPTEEKLTPRIAHTAKALWLIYVGLTLMEIILLFLAGLPFFDAVCNGLTTLAAGGFSPHPQSIMGYQNSTVTWIVTVFMFLAGCNYALQYRFIVQRQPRALLGSEEFRLYCGLVFLLAVLLCLLLVGSEEIPFADALRDGLFQVISIVTTTGFSSADFALWIVPAQAVLILVMFVGGCAGSAGGGVKVVRVLFAFKYLKREITQVVHPQAILPVKIDRNSVPDDIQRQMMGFLLFYVVLLVLSGLTVTMIEKDAMLGFIGTAATIGNIGPGFGEIGPMGTFAHLSVLTKIVFIFDMIVGRLELIPLLVLLHPDVWRTR